MTNVKALLEKNTKVSDWRIIEKATRSYELFFVHKKLETLRATDTVDTSVTVYVDHDGKRGDSTFAVYASMSDADAEEKIDLAVKRAMLVFNQPYALPAGGELKAELPTNMDFNDPQTLGRQIAEAVFAADDVPGGSINACEIFLYRDEKRVRNSRGVDKTQVTHRVMIEAIPTFTEGSESVELYEDYRFTEFDKAKVTAEIAGRMQEVKDRFAAVKPVTPLTVNVVLRPQEIRELLSDLAGDANYTAVYSHANLHNIGDDWQSGGDGDKLTFSLKSVLPGCERSAYFDNDGAALRDTRVISRGIVENQFGSTRYGQYLKIADPTGDLPYCVSAEKGTLRPADMKKAPYLECASLSGLQLDLYSDYIGGEIRLAYYFDGEKTVPVTGISMSAKLSEVLSSLRLSDDTVTQGAYEGPSRLMMKNVSVL